MLILASTKFNEKLGKCNYLADHRNLKIELILFRNSTKKSADLQHT